VIGLRLLSATIGQEDTVLCAETVRSEDRRRARAVAETDRKCRAAELCQLPLTHPLRSVARDGMRDLVSEHDGESCLILRDWEDARVDSDLAAWEAERVHLSVVVDHDEVPLKVRAVRDGSQSLPDLLNGTIRARIRIEAALRHHLLERPGTERRLVLWADEDQLRPVRVRDTPAAQDDQESECAQASGQRARRLTPWESA